MGRYFVTTQLDSYGVLYFSLYSLRYKWGHVRNQALFFDVVTCSMLVVYRISKYLWECMILGIGEMI